MAKALITPESNVTDVTIKKHVRAISAAKSLLDSAQGEYRSLLKAAKTAGLNTGQLIAAMSAKKREAEDVQSDLKNYVRYLTILDIPIQMDLFGVSAFAQSGAEEDDEDAVTDDGETVEHATWKAQEEGIDAGKIGTPKEKCSYPAGSFQASAWLDGWAKGQQTLMPKGGVKKASPRKNRTAAAPLN